MKKLILTLTAVAYLFSGTAFSQDIEYEDLFVLFLDEDFDKCLDKAEKYTLSDKTKKDPLPYLYMTMCFYEMSLDQEYAEDYPKAFQDAVKYAYKYRIKDKPGDYFHEFDDFWTDFKYVLIEEAENYFEAADYRKALNNYKNMTKFHPEGISAWLAKAVCEYYNGDASTGDETFQVFVDMYDGKEAGEDKYGNTWDAVDPMVFEELREEDVYLLKYAIMWYAEYLDSEGSSRDAQYWADQGFLYFEEDNVYKNFYDSF